MTYFMPPNIYRDRPTAEIMSHLEVWTWDCLELQQRLADPDDEPFLAAGLAHARYHVSQAVEELDRRNRLRPLPGAPRWPDRFADYRDEAARLKDALRLEDFVERYCGVALRRQGKELVGRCPLPLHEDSSPSFTVNPDKQVWHCFGCNQGGDLFTLVEAIYGPMRFGELLALVRDWSGAVV